MSDEVSPSALTSQLSPTYLPADYYLTPIVTNISVRILENICPHSSKYVCSYWNRGVAEGDLEHRNEGDLEVRKEGSR